MQKPIITEAMMDELEAQVTQTGHVEAPHDALGESPFAPSRKRGKIGVLHSESAMPRPPDDRAIAEDPINPSHYRKHPSGIECIDVTRHLNFNIGNAIKYLWRHMEKSNPIEDLKKAQWYIDDEIRRLEGKR